VRNREFVARIHSDKGVAELQWLCRTILKDASPAFRDMTIDASFYPYIGLTHTIRRKGSTWVVKISDHCEHAPSHVLEAIIRILACKVIRRKPNQRYVETYEDFRKSSWIAEAVRERRLQKGRKRIAGEKGKYYSLREIYQELNGNYFNDQIEIRRIGWGLRKSRQRLGHYDPVHHTITLSPVLDSPKVPGYVVRYIVYHEMLHAVFESTPSVGYQRHHPAAFRRAERAYPDYARAKIFLRQYGSRLHRNL
jgi:predicted metal-dependent hydrolase